MAANDLKARVEFLESQVAEIQSILKSRPHKDWRGAVEKYSGDADLLAAFTAGKKLRDADRSKAQR